MVELDSYDQEEKDVTKSVSLENNGEELLVTFPDIMEMKWTSYALKFKLEPVGAPANFTVYVTKTFMLKTMIFKDVAVHVA